MIPKKIMQRKQMKSDKYCKNVTAIKKARIIPIVLPNIKLAKNPSNVLFGLISGKGLCEPYFTPMKYALESIVEVKRIKIKSAYTLYDCIQDTETKKGTI